MARKISQEKIDAIAAEYLTNGFNKVKALTTVGYALSYAQHYFENIFSNVQLRARIEQMKAKTALKSDISRDTQIEKLNNAYKIAEDQKNPSSMVSAIREQNEMLGYHRDTAPNPEKEAEKAQKYAGDEQTLADIRSKLMDVSEMLTEQKAKKPDIKLNRAI